MRDNGKERSGSIVFWYSSTVWSHSNSSFQCRSPNTTTKPTTHRCTDPPKQTEPTCMVFWYSSMPWNCSRSIAGVSGGRMRSSARFQWLSGTSCCSPVSRCLQKEVVMGCGDHNYNTCAVQSSGHMRSSARFQRLGGRPRCSPVSRCLRKVVGLGMLLELRVQYMRLPK